MATGFAQYWSDCLRGSHRDALHTALCWLVDFVACDYVYYLYLHSWWHAFMAIGTNHLIELNQSQLAGGQFRRVGPCVYVTRQPSWRV